MERGCGGVTQERLRGRACHRPVGVSITERHHLPLALPVPTDRIDICICWGDGLTIICRGYRLHAPPQGSLRRYRRCSDLWLHHRLRTTSNHHCPYRGALAEPRPASDLRDVNRIEFPRVPFKGCGPPASSELRFEERMLENP